MKNKLIHLCTGLLVFCGFLAAAAAATVIEPIGSIVFVAMLAFPLVSMAVLSIICILDALRMLIRGEEFCHGRAFLLLQRSKLCNIPFFAVNILVWILVLPATFNPFLMWIWLFIPLAVAYAYLLLLATSSYAIVHLILFCRKDMISKRKCLLHILLQLIFVADVIDIFLLRRMEKRLVKQSGEKAAAPSEPVPKKLHSKSYLVHEIIFAYLFLIPIVISVLGDNSGFVAGIQSQMVWPGLLFPVMSLLCIVDAILNARKDDFTGGKDVLLKRVLTAKILSIPWYAGVIYLGIRIIQIPWDQELLIFVQIGAVLLAVSTYVHLLASSSYGLAYIRILHKEEKMKRLLCLLHRLLMLIPVADVVDIIILAVRKRPGVYLEQQNLIQEISQPQGE